MPSFKMERLQVGQVWDFPTTTTITWQFRGTPKWLSLSLLLSEWFRYLFPSEDQQVGGFLCDLTASEDFTQNSL